MKKECGVVLKSMWCSTQISNYGDDDEKVCRESSTIILASSIDSSITTLLGRSIGLKIRCSRYVRTYDCDLEITSIGILKRGFYENPRTVTMIMSEMFEFERLFNKYKFLYMTKKFNR